MFLPRFHLILNSQIILIYFIVIKDKRNCGMTESKGNEGCPVQTEEKERMPIANAERKEEKRSRFPDIS